MIVKVENSIFENTDTFFQKMDCFLHVVNERHFWLIDDFSNIEKDAYKSHTTAEPSSRIKSGLCGFQNIPPLI